MRKLSLAVVRWNGVPTVAQRRGCGGGKGNRRRWGSSGNAGARVRVRGLPFVQWRSHTGVRAQSRGGRRRSRRGGRYAGEERGEEEEALTRGARRSEGDGEELERASALGLREKATGRLGPCGGEEKEEGLLGLGCLLSFLLLFSFCFSNSLIQTNYLNSNYHLNSNP
jgi:hypothetical protein